MADHLIDNYSRKKTLASGDKGDDYTKATLNKSVQITSRTIVS